MDIYSWTGDSKVDLAFLGSDFLKMDRYPRTMEIKVEVHPPEDGLAHTADRLENARAVQDELGRILADGRATFSDIPLEGLAACFALPPEEAGQGVILYLHGVDYTTGSLDYAKGIGSLLSIGTGRKTMCPAYRLAPEHPYPAALEDALRAYRFLLGQGYDPGHILLCGESAGGGLCFALCLRLRELGLPQPGGIAAISPWLDLTLSGASYRENQEKDVVLDLDHLSYCAEAYAAGQDKALPYISPVFGDLAGLPRCLFFVGEDELFVSEIYAMHEALILCGVRSRLNIARHMWNGYMFHGGEAGAKALASLAKFAGEILNTPIGA